MCAKLGLGARSGHGRSTSRGRSTIASNIIRVAIHSRLHTPFSFTPTTVSKLNKGYKRAFGYLNLTFQVVISKTLKCRPFNDMKLDHLSYGELATNDTDSETVGDRDPHVCLISWKLSMILILLSLR